MCIHSGRGPLWIPYTDELTRQCKDEFDRLAVATEGEVVYVPTLLKLFYDDDPHTEGNIYIRKCMPFIYPVIKNTLVSPEHINDNTFIIGAKGCGKSIFKLVFMAKALSEGRTLLFPKLGKLWKIRKSISGCEFAKLCERNMSLAPLGNKDWWYIADQHPPSTTFLCKCVFFTSDCVKENPPKSQFFNKLKIKVYYPTWSIDELKDSLSKIGSLKTVVTNLTQLETHFRKYGGIPRLVFTGSEAEKHAFNTLLNKIDKLSFSTLQSLITENYLADVVTTSILVPSPVVNEDGTWNFLDATYNVSSEYVSELLHSRVERADISSQIDMFFHLRQFKCFRTIVGTVFEKVAHRILCELTESVPKKELIPTQGQDTKIYWERKDHKKSWHQINSVHREELDNETAFETYISNPANLPAYFSPKSKTFTGLDSFYISRDKFTAYQMTISEKHSLKNKGIDFVLRYCQNASGTGASTLVDQTMNPEVVTPVLQSSCASAVGCAKPSALSKQTLTAANPSKEGEVCMEKSSAVTNPSKEGEFCMEKSSAVTHPTALGVHRIVEEEKFTTRGRNKNNSEPLAIVSGKDRNVEILFVASEKEFKSFLPSTPNLKETLRTGKTRLETLREKGWTFGLIEISDSKCLFDRLYVLYSLSCCTIN